MEYNRLEYCLKQIISKKVSSSDELISKTKERVRNELESINDATENRFGRIKANSIWLKYAAVAMSVLVIVITLLRFNSQDGIYAYINVDINPSFEMAVDNNNRVIEARPFNSDAKEFLKGLNIKNKALQEAMEEVLKRSVATGFIKKGQDNIVYISACLNENIKGDKDQKIIEEKKLRGLLSELENKIVTVNDVKITSKIIISSPDTRKLAYKNNLSMTRYSIYEESKEKGLGYTVEDISEGRLSDILKSLESKDPINTGESRSDNNGTGIDEEVSPVPTAEVSATTVPTPTVSATAVPTPISTFESSSTPAITLVPTPMTTPISEPTPTSSLIKPSPLTTLPTKVPGKGLKNAFSVIEAENFDSKSGIAVSECYDGGSYSGLQVSPSEDGGYIVYNDVDFGNGAVNFECRMDGGKDGNTIEIRLDSLIGPLVGVCDITSTRYNSVFENFYCGISGAKGVHDVYLKISNINEQKLSINWFKFNSGNSSKSSMSIGSRIALKAVNGKFVTAENVWKAGLIALSDTVGPWETFVITDAGEGTIALKSLASGKYICAENTDVNTIFPSSDSIGPWSSFEVIDLGQGNIALKCKANSKYVSAEYEGKGALVTYRGGITGWEIFKVFTQADTMNNSLIMIEAENYSNKGGSVTIGQCMEGGQSLYNIFAGDWVKYSNVDFGNGVNQIITRAASDLSGGEIEVRIDKLDGTLIGTVDVHGTGDWEGYETFNANIETVDGVHDVFLIFKESGQNTGQLLNLNWFAFRNIS